MIKTVCYCATHNIVVESDSMKEHKYCVIIKDVMEDEV